MATKKTAKVRKTPKARLYKHAKGVSGGDPDRVKTKFIHPLARGHKRGDTWPLTTVSEVTTYAAFHGVEKAACKYIGINYTTIASWVIKASKPSAEMTARERLRINEIRLLGEEAIYSQMINIIARINKLKKAKLGGAECLKDQAAAMKSLAHTLNLLGATSQKIELSDVSESVRAARREADEALAKWEKDHATG